MNTKLAALLLFPIFLLQLTRFTPALDDALVGHWEGWADEQIYFTIDIAVVSDTLISTLNAPDQGMADITSSSMTLVDTDVKITFDMPQAVQLRMYGELKDNDSITGAYEMGEQFGTFHMQRQEKKTEE